MSIPLLGLLRPMWGALLRAVLDLHTLLTSLIPASLTGLGGTSSECSRKTPVGTGEKREMGGHRSCRQASCVFYEGYTLGGSYGWRFSRPKVVEDWWGGWGMWASALFCCIRLAKKAHLGFFVR